MIKSTEYYLCEQCGFKALIKDGIVFFDPEIPQDHKDFDATILDSLYEFEQKHFWFIHRKKIISEVVARYSEKNEKIIEIGAGTGNIARILWSEGYKNICVGEMHANGLEYAKHYGLSGLYQFDLLKTPFIEHFDVIFLFDVIEHIDRDNLAIKQTGNMLKKGGKIILTVPMYKWLWSNIDENSGHKRRYSVKTIKSLFNNKDFEILYCSHFFSLILPLLLLRKLMNKKKYKIKNNDQLTQKIGLKISPATNSILGFICKIEFALFKLFNLKTGGNLIVVCEKK